MKTIITTYIPEHEQLKENTLYVSLEYETAIHICPCGCGTESVTPIGKNGWKLTMENNEATLEPSILNRRCKTHYWIQNGEIVKC